MNFNIKANSIDNKLEKNIIKLINIKPLESFKNISNDELINIKNKIKKEFNFNDDLIKSIRSLYLKFLIIINHKNIKKNAKKILNDYDNKEDILKITEKYNISPLNILRFIFKEKYNKKLTKLINSKNIDEYDKTQLKKAIENDYYCLVNQDDILKKSMEFEKKIEKILIKNKIKFKTQEDLAKEQTELYGKPINTPDFLIESDLIINNIKINWIDAKNYYGININFYKQNLYKQTKKYIKNYGSGCIIYNNSFNNSISYNNILLLDYDSFRQTLD
jgi:hypothetical protein